MLHMAFIISFVNEKGGSAKTTSAVNVAAQIAEAMSELRPDDKPVLLIDADPACGSTIELVAPLEIDEENLVSEKPLLPGPSSHNEEENGQGSALLTQESAQKKDAITVLSEEPEIYYSEQIVRFCQTGEVGDITKSIIHTKVPGLDIMPANSYLGLAANEMALQDIAREKTLSIVFEELYKHYSWIIIDTIGAKHNILTINVLALSMPRSKCYCCIPVEPEMKNIASFYNTKAIIDTINRSNINKLDIIAAFFTKVNKRRSYDKILLDQGKELFGKAYCDTPIRYAGAVTRLATEKHAPINKVKPNCGIADDYEDLCSEIINRILGGEYNG